MIGLNLLINDRVKLYDLENIAAQIKSKIETPALIYLEGPVGAGKTTFVQHFCKDQKAVSPSYSLINEYGDEIVHADFYRIKSQDELEYLELSLYEDKLYFFAEWGVEYSDFITQEFGEVYKFYELKISINSDDTRSFQLKLFVSNKELT